MAFGEAQGRDEGNRFKLHPESIKQVVMAGLVPATHEHDARAWSQLIDSMSSSQST
jgi:hypothetical protein